MGLIITPIYGKPAADGRWEVEPMEADRYMMAMRAVASSAPIVFVRVRPREHLEAVMPLRSGIAPFARDALTTGQCHITLKSEPRRGAGGMVFDHETHGVDLRIDTPTPVSWIDGAALLNPDTWGWLCEECDASGDTRVPDTTNLENAISGRRGKLPTPKGK